MFQSLGWKNDTYRPLLDNLARAVAVLIFLGYVSIPVAVLSGFGQDQLKPGSAAPISTPSHSAAGTQPRASHTTPRSSVRFGLGSASDFGPRMPDLPTLDPRPPALGHA